MKESGVMRIKSRKQRIKEYNSSYPNRDLNISKQVKEYFKEHNWDYDKAEKKATKKLDKILNEREYETIQIIFFEYPMKTERPRKAGWKIYSPNAAENHAYFEKAWKKVINEFRLINTPAEIEIKAYLEMPSAVKPDEVLLFESGVLDVLETPDYDNIGKCYTDMLKDVLVIDDDLFHTGIIRKYYSVIPRVEVRITYLKQHESEFIYKKIKSRKRVKELEKDGLLNVKIINYKG